MSSIASLIIIIIVNLSAVSKFSYSEQVHYVREGHDGGGGGGELHEPSMLLV